MREEMSTYCKECLTVFTYLEEDLEQSCVYREETSFCNGKITDVTWYSAGLLHCPCCGTPVIVKKKFGGSGEE